MSILNKYAVSTLEMESDEQEIIHSDETLNDEELSADLLRSSIEMESAFNAYSATNEALRIIESKRTGIRGNQVKALQLVNSVAHKRLEAGIDIPEQESFGITGYASAATTLCLESEKGFIKKTIDKIVTFIRKVWNFLVRSVTSFVMDLVGLFNKDSLNERDGIANTSGSKWWEDTGIKRHNNLVPKEFALAMKIYKGEHAEVKNARVTQGARRLRSILLRDNDNSYHNLVSESDKGVVLFSLNGYESMNVFKYVTETFPGLYGKYKAALVGKTSGGDSVTIDEIVKAAPSKQVLAEKLTEIMKDVKLAGFTPRNDALLQFIPAGSKGKQGTPTFLSMAWTAAKKIENDAEELAKIIKRDEARIEHLIKAADKEKMEEYKVLGDVTSAIRKVVQTCKAGFDPKLSSI